MLSAAAALLLALLAQVTVAVSAPAEVAPRDPVLVTVEVTAPAGRDVRLAPPDFAPMRLLSSVRVASVDSTPPGGGYLRAPWQIVEWRYVLGVPDGVRGRQRFAPFVAEVRGRGVRATSARSRAWALTVRAPAQPGSLPAVVDRTPRPSRQGIAFHARLAPDTVYVGQQATYQIAVFLDDEVRLRLRRNPEFVPPELRGLLAYDLPAGRTSLRGRVIDGRRYDVHVFQRAVFPVAPGRVDVPPAQLTYALPLSSGFFSREENFSTRSEGVRLVAIEPPATGRPTDWNGAVGTLRTTARLDSSAARVGDPVVLTLRVEGEGNVKLLPRPALDVPWAGAVPGEERVELDSTALAVRGAKEFDWILTPRSAGARAVPAIRYPYFDPEGRRYEVALTPSLPLTILPGGLAGGGADPRATDGARLAIREQFGGAARTPLPSRPLFWVLVALVPLPALVLAAVRGAPRRRARPAQTPARALRALASDDGARPGQLRRCFVAAVGARLPLGPDAFAAPATFAHRLRRCGVTGDSARAAAETLRALDAAAFDATLDAAGGAGDARALARDAWATYERLDAEGCAPRTDWAPPTPRGVRAARFVMFVALAASGAGALAGLARQPSADDVDDVTVLERARAERPDAGGAPEGDAAAARAFERGVRAYEADRLGEARAAFETAAHASPRAPDAWANVGTTAWMQGDTVAAAVGWQRALRLAPTAADMRDRLALLPTPQEGVGRVPPLPPDVAAASGLLLWIAAGAAAAGRVRGRGPRALRAALWPAAGTAAVLLASGSYLTAVAEARGLAVVRTAGPLRAEPALGAEPASPVHASDLARIVGRQHAWVRVRLDGDREGWLEGDRLVSLAALTVP